MRKFSRAEIAKGHRLLRAAWALSFAAFLSGCGESPVEGFVGVNDTEQHEGISCQPGSVIACECDGRSGVRECLASGAEFGACRCGGDPTNPDTSDETQGGESTTGHASDDTTSEAPESTDVTGTSEGTVSSSEDTGSSTEDTTTSATLE